MHGAKFRPTSYLQVLFLLGAATGFLVFLLRVIPAYHYNRELDYYSQEYFGQAETREARMENGSYNATSEYLQYSGRVPLHEMDFTEFWHFSEDSLATRVNEKHVAIIALPQPVTYYDRPDAFHPVFTLDAGTEVYVCRAGIGPGYGYFGMATYNRGWHYAAPFIRADTMDLDSFVYEMSSTALLVRQKYYVRTAALMAVAEEHYIKSDPWTQSDFNSAVYSDGFDSGYIGTRDYWDNVNYVIPLPMGYGLFMERAGVWADIKEGRPWNFYTGTAEGYARMAVYGHDRNLEVTFAYVSPDFYHPYFDATNIILLSAAGVLLTLYIVLRVRKAKENL